MAQWVSFDEVKGQVGMRDVLAHYGLMQGSTEKKTKRGTELRLRCPSSQGGTPVPKPSTNEPNLVLADSPDLVEALQKAIEILKMGFSDTDGSGRDTLVRCEKVLQRSRSTYTIELPLY